MAIYVAESKAGASPPSMPIQPTLLNSSCATPPFATILWCWLAMAYPFGTVMTSILVRQARPGEEAKWRASRAKAIRHGDIESEDHAWIAFLVALTDPDRRKRR